MGVGASEGKQPLLTARQIQIGDLVLREIRMRLRFLLDVGLDYLSLDRPAMTLSGGEAQRIRLATQIGAGLTGVLYVLDEPSIGLHQRDNDRLLATLLKLRDLGNTLIVVEHDEDTIRAADHLVDIGPGAGIHGGKIVARHAQRRTVLAVEDDAVQDEPPDGARDLHHPRVPQELLQIAAHRLRRGRIGRAQVDEQDARGRLGGGVGRHAGAPGPGSAGTARRGRAVQLSLLPRALVSSLAVMSTMGITRS